VHLLAPILAHATGKSVLEYARAELFDPLGIVTRPALEPPAGQYPGAEGLEPGFAWAVDPQGFHVGATDMKLRPSDLARLGDLVRLGGKWQGRQVVPADWIRDATKAQAGDLFEFPPSQAFQPDNYGYLWWIDKVGNDAAAFAYGYGGQLIEVVPARRLVIVVVSEASSTDPSHPIVGGDEIQHLVGVITPLAV
jgi:CubicO group peptidase (beta-lactamase class C family)